MNNYNPRAERLFSLLFIIFLVALAVFSPLLVYAEQASPPIDMVQQAPMFTFKFSHTSDWSRQTQELLKITIVDVYQSGYSKVEVRIDNDAWDNVTGDVSNNAYKLYVWKNCSVTVRVTDKAGTRHSCTKVIDFFDFENPTVDAGVRSTMLHVEAADRQSGVAGVKVNDLLFTTLIDGKLDVSLQEKLNAYEKLRVSCYDHAGNTSETVVLTNPYYLAPTEQPTKEPEATATPKPTKKPSSSSGSSSTKKPQATTAPTATPVIEPTAAPMVTPYIVGPGQPYVNSGNMNTLDMLYASHTNKQFITVQTKNGETYYLVIDYDKPIDEDGDIYETYFLNLVDDRDLMDVIDEEDLPTPTPIPTAVPTVAPTTPPVIDDEPEPKETSNNGLILLAIVGLGGIGVGYFFMKKKHGPQNQPAQESEYDYDDDDEDDILSE